MRSRGQPKSSFFTTSRALFFLRLRFFDLREGDGLDTFVVEEDELDLSEVESNGLGVSVWLGNMSLLLSISSSSGLFLGLPLVCLVELSCSLLWEDDGLWGFGIFLGRPPHPGFPGIFEWKRNWPEIMKQFSSGEI